MSTLSNLFHPIRNLILQMNSSTEAEAKRLFGEFEAALKSEIAAEVAELKAEVASLRADLAAKVAPTSKTAA